MPKHIPVLPVACCTLLFVMGLSSQNARPGSNSGATLLPPDVARDAYALYSSIYRNSRVLGPDEAIAISLDVDSFPNGHRTEGCLRPETVEERSMVENAIRLSRSRHVWESRFDFGRRYRLLSQAEAVEAENCFQRGHRGDQKECEPYLNMRFVRNLSAPGFNADHTRALVSTSRLCGGLCGQGGLAVYRKTGQGWEQESNSFAKCVWVY